MATAVAAQQPARQKTVLRPQTSQEKFLSSSADIAIFGGSAGGGKTWSLLAEPLRHINNPAFGAVIFRRTYPQIMRQGGLWDKSGELYPYIGGVSNKSEMTWLFQSGAKVSFSHMQYDDNVFDWQGTEIPLIEFDELTHFSERQFFYMLSRNRSLSGVKPYIRATCNPDPDSWVAKFIEWWIDPNDGYADLSKSGKVRWFIRWSDEIIWADTRRELLERYPGCDPKSVTFILSTLFDNKILMEKDPGYLANLMAMSLVDREQLLGDRVRGGNWHIRPAAGKLFNRAWFQTVDAIPAGGKWCRGWDLAATERKLAGDDPDFTAGCLMAKVEGVYYIADAIAEQQGPAQVDRLILNTAGQDLTLAQGNGAEYCVRWEIEPGASGKRDTRNIVNLLDGFDARGKKPQGDKVLRAKGLSAQAEAGNVKLLRGPWNDRWLTHMHHQPDWPHDDEMDGASISYTELGRPEAGIK